MNATLQADRATLLRARNRRTGFVLLVIALAFAFGFVAKRFLLG